MKKLVISKKLIGSAIALTMAGVVAVTSVSFRPKEVMAKETFQGIKDIVAKTSDDAPFNILEITPGKIDYVYGKDPATNEDLSIGLYDGQIGYYIDGYEPIMLSKLLGEAKSYAERKALIERFLKYDGGKLSGTLAEYASISDNSAPLTYTEYKEALALTDFELEVDKHNGINWTKIESEGDKEDTVTGFKAVRTVSENDAPAGRLIKTVKVDESKDPAVTPIAEGDVDALLYGADESSNDAAHLIGTTQLFNDVSTTRTGDFDPAFSVADNGTAGKYNAAFTKINAAAGYVVKEMLQLTDDQIHDEKVGDDSISGAYVYKRITGDMDYFVLSGYIEGGEVKTVSSNSLLSTPDDGAGDDDTFMPIDIIDDGDVDYDIGLPGIDDPDDNPEDDSSKDEPSDTPSDTPNEDDPSKDEPSDTPGEDDPSKDKPSDTPTGDDPSKDEPSEDEPKKDEPSKSESPDGGEDRHALNLPKAGEAASAAGDLASNVEILIRQPKYYFAAPGSEPDPEGPKEGEPSTGEPKEDEPKKDEPSNDEPKEDEPKEDEPSNDGPSEDTPKEDAPSEGDIGNDLPGISDGDEQIVIDDTIEIIDIEDDELVIEDKDEEDLDEEILLGAETEYFLISFAYDSNYEPSIAHYCVDQYKVNTTTERGSYNYATFKASETAADEYLLAYPNLAGKGIFESVDAPDYFRYESGLSGDALFGNYDFEITEDPAAILRLFNVPLYYTGGITNNEWFKKYVFDREVNHETGVLTENINLNVIQAGPTEASSYDLMGVGLLYLCAGNTGILRTADDKPYEKHYEKSSNDISMDYLYKVVNAVVTQQLPVIVDAEFLSDDLKDTNIGLLARILQRANVKVFFNSYMKGRSGADLRNAIIEKLSSDSDSETWFISKLHSHHVNESIYIYNREVGLFNKSFLDTADFKGNEEKNKCFEEIAELIESENMYIKDERGEDAELIPTDINEAVAIKYILSFAGRRTAHVKGSINVLELEPCPVTIDTESIGTAKDKCVTEGNLYVVKDSSDRYSLYRKDASPLRDNYDKNPESYGTQIIEPQDSPIVLTRMSTNEFVGHTEDISSQYDLVYIGLNTNLFSHSSNGRTEFNDKNMNGLAYINVGDVVITSQRINGLKSRDFDGSRLVDPSFSHYGSHDDAGKTRYAGNDITVKKRDALLEYLKAAYPVIVDYNCYIGDKYSTEVYDETSAGNGYIDNCTYMYSFLDMAAEKYGVNKKNLIRLNSNGAVHEDTKNLLTHYLNMPKPTIVINESVSPISTDPKQIKDFDSAGNPRLQFEFEIQDYRSTDPDLKYTAQLFLDDNCDGRFAKNEEVKDFSITMNGSSVSPKDLKKGKTIEINAISESTQSGPIPWRIVVTLNGDNSRRDEQIGCFRVSPKDGRKIPVHILQLLPDNRTSLGKNYWELPDLPSSFGSNDTDIDQMAASTDYELFYHPIESKDFAKAIKADGYAYLSNYDVLVLGFAWNYNILRDSATTVADPALTEADLIAAEDAIVKYIKAGRPTVLGAGVTSPINVPNYSFGGHIQQDIRRDGYYLTRALRDLIGQDRYDIIGNSGNDKSKKVKSYVPNSNKKKETDENQGFAAPIVSLASHNMGRLNTSIVDRPGIANDSYNGKAIALNKGVVSLYPRFVDPDVKFNVSNTTPPYYSLDLDTQDQDGEEAVMVWYTMKDYNAGGNRFFMNDARDMYYCYTRNNIRFINVAVTSWEPDEIKIMLNILITAYEAGNHTPKVAIIDNEVDKNDIDSITVPIDANAEITDETQDIYYHVPGSFTGTDLYAQYFYEDEGGTVDPELGVAVKELPVNSITDTTTGATIAGNGYGTPINVETVYKINCKLKDLLTGKTSRNVYVKIYGYDKDPASGEPATLSNYDKVTLLRTELFNLD